MPTIQEAFRRTFASRLRVHFADLNPPSPQHPVIKDVFEVQNTIWSHWTMDDNPILTEERKQELFRILSKNPFLLERDWYGNRCIPQGVIYSMFSHEENIAKEIPENERPVEMFFAGDGGLKDATAVGCFIVARKPDRQFALYMVGLYYYSGTETGYTKALSIQAKEISETFIPYCVNKWKMQWSEVLIDPACLALREELHLHGIQTRGADNNGHDIKGSSKGIQVGIERLQSLMAKKLFKLVNTETYGFYPFLRELTLYVVDQHGKPVDMYNHCCDMVRYACNYYTHNYALNVV
jgi:PBSX family phage terminase large subunit